MHKEGGYSSVQHAPTSHKEKRESLTPCPSQILPQLTQLILLHTYIHKSPQRLTNCCTSINIFELCKLNNC